MYFCRPVAARCAQLGVVFVEATFEPLEVVAVRGQRHLHAILRPHLRRASILHMHVISDDHSNVQRATVPGGLPCGGKVLRGGWIDDILRRFVVLADLLARRLAAEYPRRGFDVWDVGPVRRTSPERNPRGDGRYISDLEAFRPRRPVGSTHVVHAVSLEGSKIGKGQFGQAAFNRAQPDGRSFPLVGANPPDQRRQNTVVHLIPQRPVPHAECLWVPPADRGPG